MNRREFENFPFVGIEEGGVFANVLSAVQIIKQYGTPLL